MSTAAFCIAIYSLVFPHTHTPAVRVCDPHMVLVGAAGADDAGVMAVHRAHNEWDVYRIKQGRGLWKFERTIQVYETGIQTMCVANTPPNPHNYSTCRPTEE